MQQHVTAPAGGGQARHARGTGTAPRRRGWARVRRLSLSRGRHAAPRTGPRRAHCRSTADTQPSARPGVYAAHSPHSPQTPAAPQTQATQPHTAAPDGHTAWPPQPHRVQLGHRATAAHTPSSQHTGHAAAGDTAAPHAHAAAHASAATAAAACTDPASPHAASVTLAPAHRLGTDAWCAQWGPRCAQARCQASAPAADAARAACAHQAAVTMPAAGSQGQVTRGQPRPAPRGAHPGQGLRGLRAHARGYGYTARASYTAWHAAAASTTASAATHVAEAT